MKDKAYIHDDEYYYSIIRKNIRKYRLEKKTYTTGLSRYDRIIKRVYL